MAASLTSAGKIQAPPSQGGPDLDSGACQACLVARGLDPPNPSVLPQFSRHHRQTRTATSVLETAIPREQVAQQSVYRQTT